MQLDSLWNYMQVDMEADSFESEMRNSPNRQQMLKNRNFIMEQQTNMKNIEADIANKGDRMEAIEVEAARLGELVKAQTEAFQAGPPTELEEIDKQLLSIQKLLDSLSLYEQELAKMQHDAEGLDRQQKDIRVRAARSKAEYDQLKQEYDVEYKRDTQQLAKLRENAEAAGKGIDEVLLSQYKSIKQHSTPPMAMLVNDQCGGCFMAQPAVVLRELKANEKVVCCDNCGRILFAKED
ncbi:C4-type zinc ribbon domain-containing protein [Eubacteriales bacterium OttesenSCG-928-N13]|nr:C4-type zinc ribbon domain-containing protein [Eubacteriales bacterium OttesenSCG-928-N13]